MRDVDGTMSGREKRVCGSNGTTPKASTFGAISDPPAERKYAVEPVGVATQIPSAAMRVTAPSSTRSPNGSIRASAPVRTPTSLRAKQRRPPTAGCEKASCLVRYRSVCASTTERYDTRKLAFSHHDVVESEITAPIVLGLERGAF